MEENVIFDLHIHSKYSFDSILEPKILIKVAKKRGLNCVAITDHNTIKGGLMAKNINEDQDFLVIVGSEISTEVGDIIGLFLNEEIRSGNIYDVIEKIKNQGGIVVLPHPYKGHKLSNELVKNVDAIEVFNARINKENNKKAIALAKKCKKPGIAGSDAHFASEIGNVKVQIPTLFHKDIKKSLLSNEIEIIARQSSHYFEFLSQIIKSIKMKEVYRIPIQTIRFINFYKMK